MVLLLHTVAQVVLELGYLGLTVVEEGVSLDHQEVRVELLHRDDLGELGIDGDLVKLSLSQLRLQIVVLLLDLSQIERLFLVLLVP